MANVCTSSRHDPLSEKNITFQGAMHCFSPSKALVPSNKALFDLRGTHFPYNIQTFAQTK